MDESIAQKLIQLNAEFYQTFATHFSDTRGRIQPGVRRILNEIDPAARILDLGCGNGEFARELHRHGFNGQYIGLDFSEELLTLARAGVASVGNFRFIQGNLAKSGWQDSVTTVLLRGRSSESVNDSQQLSAIPIQQSQFTIILAFAALHHIPGKAAQLQILQAVHALLVPGGRFIHSNWQFLNSERLRKRIHPWPEIGLSASDVDSGDYLLDWRRGGFGMRYVHHFSEKELNAMAEESGFRVLQTFYSDGETGDLGLYQIWEI
jgi:SAM-dependent methyltransferase